MQTITVTITPDGSPTIEAHGVKGKGCRAVTEFLEKGLAGDSKTTHKAEYYQQNTNTQTIHQ